MKLRSIVSLIAAITGVAMSAQNPNTDFKFGIKLYNLTRYEPIRETVPVYPMGMNHLVITKEQFKMLHPTIALQVSTRKGNVHELEFTDLKLDDDHTTERMVNDSIKMDQVVFEEKVKESAFAIRYEYILNFRKKKDCRLVPSLGFAGSPYYNSLRTQPVVSYGFSTKEQHMGLKAFVVPRLTYYTTKKIYFDVNLPLCVASAEFFKRHTEDPSVPLEEKNSSSIDFDLFKKMFSARIGIGIKI